MGSKAPQPPPGNAHSARRGVTCTQRELAAAFTEWERRYREEPDRFMSEASKLLKHTPESYGEQCAPYLMALLRGEV